MKKYRVMVEGVNFLIGMEEGSSIEVGKYGFFTTRFVEALDADDAETKVIEMLRVELKTMVQNEKSDSPMMFVDEMEELETFGEFEVPGRGFTWFPDEHKGH